MTNLFANMSAAERAYWNALMASASESDPRSVADVG
jgi:hypothetical protein